VSRALSAPSVYEARRARRGCAASRVRPEPPACPVDRVRAVSSARPVSRATGACRVRRASPANRVCRASTGRRDRRDRRDRRVGAAGRPGPTGLPGVQGPRGAAGPAWLDQPSPAELVHNVVRAALDVTPRTVLDPRAGYRYWTTLASRLVKLPGGLLLRAMITMPDADAPADRSNARSIA